MKKTIAFLLCAMMVVSFAGCNGVPSDEKIKTALNDGKITIEDAKEKGWIDDEWIEENFEWIEGGSKIHLFTTFETTYLDGTATSSDIIAGEMCLVFFNTEKEETIEKLKIYNDAYDKLKELGVPILGVLLDEDIEAAKEKLTDTKFPILIYNDEMQEALAEYNELFDTDVISVFTKEGGFYTAWSSEDSVDKLVEYAEQIDHEE